MLKKLGMAAIAGGALMLASSAASAITISGSCSTITTQNTELGTNLACSQFNGGLGSLNSITLTVGGNISGSISLLNNATGAGPQVITGSTQSFFTVAPLAGFSVPVNFQPPSYLFTFQAFQFASQSLGAGSSVTVNGLSGSGSTGPLVNTNVGSFANYIGLSTFNIGLATQTLFSAFGAGGQAGGSQSTQANAYATVVYDYSAPPDEAPEPATIAILGAGLAGLGALRRRKRS